MARSYGGWEVGDVTESVCTMRVTDWCLDVCIVNLDVGRPRKDILRFDCITS